MASPLRNRLPAFDVFLLIIPTVMVWWLFLPFFQLRKRIFGAIWAFVWTLILRVAGSVVGGPFPMMTKYAMYLTLGSIAAFGVFQIYGALRSKIQIVQSNGQAEEADNFFRQLGGEVRVISDPGILLTQGESIIHREQVEIFEYKQSGISYSEGRSIRSLFGGPTVYRGRSERDTREVLTPCGEAVLCVTNLRVLVLGRNHSVSKYIDQIVDLRAEQQFFVLSLSGVRKPLYMRARNPFIPIGFCRLLVSGQFGQMRLVG